VYLDVQLKWLFVKAVGGKNLDQPENTDRNHDKLLIAYFPTDIRNRDPRIRRRNANRYTKTIFMQLQVKRLYIFECIEKSNLNVVETFWKNAVVLLFQNSLQFMNLWVV